MRRWRAAAPAVLAVTVVVVGAVTPGYRPLADTVSGLGSPGQPYAFVARAGFVLYGVLVIVGAPTVLVGLYGSAGIVAGLAPKDPPGASPTRLSPIHVDATVAGGVAVVVAMLVVAFHGPARRDRRVAGLAAAFTALAAAAFRLSWGSATYGLVERVLLAVPAVWVAATGQGPTRRASSTGSTTTSKPSACSHRRLRS